jgi:bifunctional UDP-N-acetylglucosamine pyrophosphorylase/glucosamine-1-phosphate N-acetyltransferase
MLHIVTAALSIKNLVFQTPGGFPMKELACVILAAGKSTRMKSATSKVLQDLAGRPVISYSIEAAKRLGADPIVVVTGPDDRELASYLKEAGVARVIQSEAKGTGHAVMSAARKLSGIEGDVLILCGDVPLVRSESLQSFVKDMRSQRAAMGVLTMIPADPASYGRIVRDLDGRIIRIVEARDANAEELASREVNSGIICARREWLFRALKRIGNDNAKGEYYLTDLVGIALREGLSVAAHLSEPAEDFLGINTRVDLARVAEIMRERINKAHMLAGVGVMDFRHTYIDEGVKLGQDTTVMPHAFLRGKTRVGRNCIIENGVVLTDAVIADNVHVKSYSVIEESQIEEGATVGPFARVRPGSKVGRSARVGNFVELKKCTMKRGAKASHLTYLGDAIVGEGANIGCGTITCNYDGVHKHLTVIGDGAFVGSDTQFIAPVSIGKGSVIGAGSTITKDVPAHALSLSRTDQKIVSGWAMKKDRKASKGKRKG